MFKNKKILITGGTGSLGTALTSRLLETDIDTIRIFSRDELKQSQMESDFNDDRLRFLIGDIRDKERLEKAVESIDIVIHTAALKQVPVIEYNPFEAIKTNVQGAQNLVEACLNKDVEFALAIGTDKAVSPFNTYGATKLLMERLFVSANYYKGYHKTKFSCVRYGNVLGSRGSILPVFVNQIISGKKITITDPNMTRFNITMDQALDLIFRVIKNSHGGDVYVPKLNAYRVGDIKDVLLDLMDSKNETVRIPVRIGEKYHETLINEHEIRNTYENQDNDYVILGDDIKVGALDMREPKKGTGLQDLHIDWIPKKSEDVRTENLVAMLFLDDTDENNGHMRIVPKTHKKTGWIQENQDQTSSHPDQMYVDIKKTGIILMDANLWHSGTTNINGKRRRVLFLDIRRRETPQLLNQRIYLDEIVQKKLTDIQKFLLGLGDNDTIFEDRVHTAGNLYRKQFKTTDFVKVQS